MAADLLGLLNYAMVGLQLSGYNRRILIVGFYEPRSSWNFGLQSRIKVPLFADMFILISDIIMKNMS